LELVVRSGVARSGMSEDEELDFDRLAGSVSTRFETRVIDLEPSDVVADEAARWDEAIIFVTEGEIEVQCVAGARRRFRRGDVLTFALFPGCIVKAVGVERARLLAIWRRDPPDPNAG
jgi:quercetin dioxygenase-like cupin family protein